MSKPKVDSTTWKRLTGCAIVASVLMMGVALATHLDPEPPPPAQPQTAPLESRELRARRVCEATRSRVMRGGTVSPVDAEGWSVELSLLRVARQPSLFAAVSPTLVRQETGALRLYGAPDSEEEWWTITTLDDQRHEHFWQSTLTFDASAARRYFDAQERLQLFRAAQRLARAVNASHGAIYARCQDSTSLHIGSWFWGRNAVSALASLIAFTTGYSGSPLLDSQLTHDSSQRRRPLPDLLLAIEQRTASLNRKELSLWLADEQAALVGQSPLHIVFPFQDSNRAARAGLRIARQLGMAD